MATLSNPAEIARETLKQLMTRRMAPSPDNYQSIYNEIAGIGDGASEGSAEREFKTLLLALPKETPAQQRLARLLEQALKEKNAEDYQKTLVEFIAEHSAESELNWGELFADFLRQWEAKQASLTPARKRESLEHVLASATKNGDIFYTRLQNLVRSWAQNNADETVLIDGEIAPPPETPPSASPAAAAPSSRASELLPELRNLFAYTLETVVATQLDDDPELASQAKALATSVRSATTIKAMDDLLAETKRFAFRLEFLAEDRAELR